MIALPFTDATLQLVLPFTGHSPLFRISISLGIAIAFLWLVVRLHRREMNLVSMPVAWSLLGLRLAVLATIVFALIADPTLTRTRQEEVPGRVLVALDCSDSMTASDPNRPLAEKLRLAKMLNLAPELAAESELDAWAADVERGSPPRFSSDSERLRYDGVLNRVSTTPRWELARRLLAKDGLNLLPTLAEKHTVEFFGFSPDLQPLPVDPARLEKALTPTPREGRPMICTDLKLPLSRAAESVGADSDTKLLGVILLTDGRHNWGTSPLPRATELGQRGVPVYSIAIAPREAPTDVAILSARASAATVFKGSTVPVDVAVRVNGWPAGPIPVTLANPDGKQPSIKETIEHNGTDATYQLSFKVKLDDPGPQRLQVHVDAGASDRFPENNRRTARVNVVKDRARVLLLDGEARWEFHYLHTCLGRDPNMDISSVVFRQPRIKKVAEEELRAAGIPARRLPDDLDVLTGYDAIVLGDVELPQITPDQRKKLESYVADSGGTLIISAGKRAMPLSFSAENEPFRKLLPIQEAKEVESLDGFPLAFTPAGERSWFLTMGDTSGESRAAWEKFPLHPWGVAGDLKDGAEALATHPNGKALIARQNYGFGRVLYVGIDSTWRWRFKTGDYYHHRFWGQVAQWAASDRLLPVANAAGTIRFGPREPVYSGPQDVEVVARAAESVKRLTAQDRKAVRIIRLPSTPNGKETTAALVPMTHPEGRPLDLHAKIPDLTPGRYAVELDIPALSEELRGPPGADGRSAVLRGVFEVEPPDDEEMIDLAANWTLLTELADASGGKVVTPENAAQIAEWLAQKTATRQVTVERPLRQSWWVFAVLLSLLSCEWILRKYAGLP